MYIQGAACIVLLHCNVWYERNRVIPITTVIVTFHDTNHH